MNVIISHEGHEWKVLPESNDFTLNVFNSILEAKLHCSQSFYTIIKFECQKKCLTCKSNR
jgi:hypothetical protein